MRFWKMRTFRLTLIILTTLTVDSYSCVCKEFNRRQLFKDAEYVFLGQAIKNLHVDSHMALLMDERGTGTNTAFKVEKVLKGEIGLETIAIIQNNGNCAMRFKLGDRYVIFGWKMDKIFTEQDLDQIPLDSTELRHGDSSNNEIYDEHKMLVDFEDRIKKDYRLKVATSQCSCFYETGKTYKKYMRRKRTAGNNVHVP